MALAVESTPTINKPKVALWGRLLGIRTPRKANEAMWGYIFLLPWALGLLIFILGPILASAYLSFSSDILRQNQITDYLVRVVQPRLTALEGVQRAEILGARTFAMRIWLKPDRMAALNISPAQVRQALSCSATGSATTVRRGLGALIERYGPDEVMITGMIHDHAARLKSITIAAEVLDGLIAAPAA